ncbi:hypothetical protein DY000_02044790 [Brassica cretica]|uniref:PPM-type phosphatase domain-containing protein n=1 Tax=Brassica cretica TaxID=69181 RepID=A0ABQ7EWA4_BRACR|nr:hypothetical protein DY000_02044790 [Brassica cretica]
MSPSGRTKHSLVPLATLIGRELRSEKVDKPLVLYGQAALAKKAAVCTKEHLLDNVLSAIPRGATRDEWLQALPSALVAGFVKTDIEFQHKGETSGTTVTFVIIDGWIITVGSVGDSRCILDTQGGVVSLLTVDHRLEENVEDRERITASGGEVGRLNVFGGNAVGPLRCWPGGLRLSRSIGDTDRSILSSDMAAKACRGLSAELAAKLVVKEALGTKGLKDDTTCVVVDIVPADHLTLAPTPSKKQNTLTAFLSRTKHSDTNNKNGNKLSSVGVVEELFEEGSAVLADRLGKDLLSNTDTGLLKCAVCQIDQSPAEGLSSNEGPIVSSASKRWEGPFLCTICKKKKDAMEGKRPSKVSVTT